MKKRTGIFVVVGVVVVLAAVGVGLTVTGFLPKLLGMKPPEGTIAATVVKEKPKEPLVPERYYDMPTLVLSMETGRRENRIMQLGISLLMENRDDASKMHAYLPLLIDAVQVYVRTLPPSETETVERLASHRDELLKRINAAIDPIKVEEISLRQVQQQ
jgi:flagellar FliL protein